MSFNELGYTEGTGVNVAAHDFSEEGKTKLVERVAPGVGVLNLPASPQISKSTVGTYPSGTIINCAGRSRIVIKSMFQYQGQSADFRLKLYDISSGEIGYTQKLTVDELGLPSGEVGLYYGTLYAVSNEFGAAGLQARIVSTPSSGEIKMTIGTL